MKALVTGASGGIGQAVARALHASGARLALAGRKPAALAQLQAELPGTIVLPGDLIDAAYVATLVGSAATALSGLDVFVSCAGVVHYQAIGQISRPELHDQMQINFVAPFLLAQDVAQHMRDANHGGAMVMVASTLGIKPAPLTAAYAASKAALISLTRTLALELGPQQIRVNAIAPGIIDTEMVAARDRAQLRELHLLRRLGTAGEVAEAVSYLLAATFVTGTVLTVDGGLLLHG